MGFPLTIPLNGEQILTTTTDKRHPLGTRGTTRDGRVFHYARNAGTALGAGLVVQSAVEDNSELILDSGTSEVKGNSSRIKLIASATSLFTTKNAYADGFVWSYTSSTAKSLPTYAQIRGHTTNPGTASKNVVITFDLVDGDSLYSPTTNLGTTAAKFAICRNPYDKVVVKPGGEQTMPVVGVPVRPIGVNAYFWIQTWGPCPVRSRGVLDCGYDVGPSSGATAGVADGITCTKATSAANSLVFTKIRNLMGASIGVAMKTGVAGEYRMIFLKIAP